MTIKRDIRAWKTTRRHGRYERLPPDCGSWEVCTRNDVSIALGRAGVECVRAGARLRSTRGWLYRCELAGDKS